MIKSLFFLVLLIAFSTQSLAHGGKKHKKDSAKARIDSIAKTGEQVKDDTTQDHNEVMKVDESKVGADLDDFPSLHPLIVHFAIALIIVAAVLQFVNLIVIKKEIAWIVFSILFIGVMAAWLAGRNFHPHTHGLSDHAKLVLEQHDKWADLTIYFGFAGLVLKGINLFVFKSNRWAMAIVATILAISSYAVLHAGHYGAQLVHIEGIGPQGKYLEMQHHH